MKKALKAPCRWKRGMVLPFLISALWGCVTTPEPQVETPPLQTPRAGRLEPAPLPTARREPSQVPTGSLWSQSTDSLFQDIKARKVGDLLTITVSEQSQARKTALTETERGGGLSADFNFSGVTTPTGQTAGGPYAFEYGINSKKDFTGEGVTSKSDSMTAYMTVTVVDVLPNKNLVVRGSRWTKVNNEMQQIVLEGIVRPMDITRNNTVLSQNVADAKIYFVGKGQLTQHQKPGWLGQIIDFVSPF